MEYYRYDETTGEFLYLVQCQRNPLKPNEFFPVENATPILPPEPGKHQVPVFKDNLWQLNEDHRGKTAYHKTDKSELEIKDLGPIPETHTSQKPSEFDEWNESANRWQHNNEKEHNAKAETERAWAMHELALTDRCQTPDFPITEEGRQQITEYRRQLRNPARSEHELFPEPQWRPQWPEGVKRPAG